MRLLMTTDTVGGVWNYSLELARVLSAWNVTITLAIMGPRPTPAQSHQVERLHHVRMAQSDFKLEWMEDPWEDVTKAGQWLRHLARSARCDLVHLNNYAHGSVPFEAPKIVVAHSCVLSWWRAVKGEDAPLEWNRYRSAVARGLRAADRIIAPTRTMLDSLENLYGVQGGKVVFNGRNASAYQPRTKKKFILGAGRLWDPAKNLRVLEEVAEACPWPIRLAGETCLTSGESSGGSSGENPPHSHQPSLEFLGRLSETEMAARMAEAAIFVHPARYEPFGLAPLEAALSGCALVLGDIPSLREVWGDAAWFVPPEDPRAIREVLCELTQDSSLRRSLAAKSWERGLRYRSDTMGRAYMDVYRSCLATRQKKHPAHSIPAFIASVASRSVLGSQSWRGK